MVTVGDVHESTIDDIDRCIKEYIQPDDMFAIRVAQAVKDDWDVDKIREELIIPRIREESGQEYEESLGSLLYDSNLRLAINIIVKDKFDEIAEAEKIAKTKRLKRTKITRKDGTYYYRTKARAYNIQELLFFTQRLSRGYKFKDIVESYGRFFGDVRTKSALRNKYYRESVKRKIRLKKQRTKRELKKKESE